MTQHEAAEFWENRYGERDQIWSGNPNRALVTTVTGFRPGRALDLGSGEGGDSVWLAEQGWQVSAVDISTTAIARAKILAARRHIPEGRINWLTEDLSAWHPTESYHLVSACFLHSPVDFPRSAVLQRAASAVAPGGHLLIVGHADFPPWANPDRAPSRCEDPSPDSARNHRDHRFLSPAEEIAELQLDDADWNTVISEVRPRQTTGPNGQQATLDDTVVLLRRCGG